MKKTPGVSLPAPGSRFEVSVDIIDEEGRGRGLHPDFQSTPIDVAVRGAFPGDQA